MVKILALSPGDLMAVVVTVILTIVVTTVLGQQRRNEFDIVPGKLVYFGSTQAGDTGPVQSSGNRVGFSISALDGFGRRDHDHARHYNKGNLRRIHFRKRQFDNEKNARRQGQQCPGVCKYIPDRDFCPTNVVPVPAEEYEAYDEEYDEDYYSEEEENSEEEYYYYDDEEETEEDDYYNEVDRRGNKGKRRIGGKSVEPRKRLMTEPRLRGNETSQVYGKTNRRKKSGGNFGGKPLHVVYPSITQFVALKGETSGKVEIPQGKGNNRGDLMNVEGRRNRMPARRRRRRQRIPVVNVPALRPPALEQEILIRWDHVFERGPFIGGDIVLPEGVLLRPPNLRYLRKQWPAAEIPFTMDPSLNPCRQSTILDAMDEIEEKTCIRFLERDDERNYIEIRRATVGCSSYVGMVGGAQHLNLSTGCFSKFTVTHELMHAIGFDHEQSRRDRDKFIDIDFDNVLKEKEGQFELNPSFTSDGFPYDIRSIMHYSAFLFAKDKCEPTIYPVNEKIDICELGVGNGKGGMTDCDAAKINKMYNCKGKKYPKKCKVKK